MNKKVRATLLVEVEKETNFGNVNEEEVLSSLVEEVLDDYGLDVRKCEVLKSDYGLILEQLKRVDEAELKYQMEVAQLNELMKKLEKDALEERFSG